MVGMEISIKELRLALGMTQAQLADSVGVDVMTVSCWERGLHAPRGRAVLRELEKLKKQAARAARKKTLPTPCSQ